MLCQNQGWVYKSLPFDKQGRLISQRLELALTRWRGVYEGLETTWLWWETLDGILLPIKKLRNSFVI